MPSPVVQPSISRPPQVRPVVGGSRQSRILPPKPSNDFRFQLVVSGSQRRVVGGAYQSRIPRPGSAPNPPVLTAPLSVSVLNAGQGVFTVKQGATVPPLIVQLRDANGPVPLNSATSLEFHLRYEGASVTTVHGQGTGDGGGNFIYYWQPGDLPAAGKVQMEWKVAWGNQVARWPDTSNVPGVIVSNLD